MKAKIQFLRIGDRTIYRVLEQDGVGGGVFSGEHVAVYSASTPEIRVTDGRVIIFLRGENKLKNDCASITDISKTDFDAMMRELDEKCPEISVDVSYIHPGDTVVMRDFRKLKFGHFVDSFGFRSNSYQIFSINEIAGVDSYGYGKTPLFYALVCDGAWLWKKTCVINGNLVDYDAGTVIQRRDVAAVRDISYCKFAQCQVCGEVFAKTKAEIRKHLEKGTSLKTCAVCPDCYRTRESVVNEKTRIDKGVYYRTVTSTFVYACNRGNVVELNFNKEPKKPKNCRYACCAENKIMPLEIPIEAPHTLLTAEALHTVYKRKTIGNFDDVVATAENRKLSVKINGTDSLSAIVLDGLIVKWEYMYRRHNRTVRFNNDTKKFLTNDYGITENVPKKIRLKIAQIYQMAEDEEKKGSNLIEQK